VKCKVTKKSWIDVRVWQKVCDYFSTFACMEVIEVKAISIDPIEINVKHINGYNSFNSYDFFISIDSELAKVQLFFIFQPERLSERGRTGG
jgi:hypothetical protein